MPFDQVMHKFKHGQLHSGSDSGPQVQNRKQAIAIMLSEKRKADAGKQEYKSVGPSPKTKKKMFGNFNKKKSQPFMPDEGEE
jgi:hypothetical protein